MRGVSNWDTGFPHMRGGISPRAATVAELLRAHGYATYAAGKWHMAPMQECSTAGPHTNWPLQKRFDRFYGFLQAETDQFHPELTSDNGPFDPPVGPEDAYHVSEDIVDKVTGWIGDLHSIRPDRPFFLYLAFGAPPTRRTRRRSTTAAAGGAGSTTATTRRGNDGSPGSSTSASWPPAPRWRRRIRACRRGTTSPKTNRG